MTNVIILSGKMHSGKDTFADKLKLKLEKRGDDAYKVAYADSTKSDVVRIIKFAHCFIIDYRYVRFPFIIS